MNANIIVPHWPAPKNIHAFTTLRHGLGLSSPPFDRFNLGNHLSPQGDDPAVVEKNRALLVHEYALPNPPHWLKQVHGVDVLRCVDRPENHHGEYIADASVTANKNIVLSILTADCLPVLFCNAAGNEVAAAHAGWRGLVGGVLENTVNAMTTVPENIIAWLGPAAGPKAYEIGMEVRDAFLRLDASADAAFTNTRENHWRVDLYQLARMRLQSIGVKNIYGGDHCTISEPEKFFSHRREQRTGRMASLIWFE
jgi:polyphenol oxidase